MSFKILRCKQVSIRRSAWQAGEPRHQNKAMVLLLQESKVCEGVTARPSWWAVLHGLSVACSFQFSSGAELGAVGESWELGLVE